MRKKTSHAAAFGLAALLAGGFFQPANADSFKLLPGIPNGISPDGKTVVGNKVSYGDNNLFVSFVYTTDNGESVWVTDYKENDLLKSGLFNAVTNDGIKVGAVKNPNLRLPKDDGGDDFFRPKRVASAENEGEPITSAAVWRDGKLHILDMGGWNDADFEDSLDGSYATGISEDGAIVVGYIQVAWFIQTPCYWYWDTEKEEYIFGAFVLGDNCPVGRPVAFSPVEAILVGEVSFMEADGARVTANVWNNPNETEMLAIPEQNSPYYSTSATAISEDGRYVGVGGRGAIDYLGIYDRTSKTYHRIPIPTDSYESSVLAVTNDGSAFVRYTLEGVTSLYYFDLKTEAFVDIKYYLNDVAPSVASQVASNAVVTAVSGDGKTLIGRNGDSGWCVKIDNPEMLTVKAPSKIHFAHNTPKSVVLSWEGVEIVPEGTVLKGYKAYINNQERFFASTAAGGSFEWTVEGEGSAYSAYIQTVFEKNGDEFVSPKSEIISSYASSETTSKMLETFDDASMMGEQDIVLNNDYWSIDAEGEGTNDIIRWHPSLDDFDNRSVVMQMYSVSTYPWSCRLQSRFLATEKDRKDITFSMRYKRRAVNQAGQDFSYDRLDVELTTDGKNWTTVASIKGNEAQEGAWNSLYVTVPMPESDFYRVRINANGAGTTHLMWLVDDISINQPANSETATGLRVIRQDSNEGLTLGWHNEIGVHQLSYLENSPIQWDYNVGNEGKPMMVAVDFPSSETAPFNGEYICGIASFIYDDPEIAGLNATSAQGVLFEDNKEVARAVIYSEFNQANSSFAMFDSPVEIKPGKTYRAAVRISDYPVEQAPLYYQAGLSMKPGVTDLFSEDEGQTWQLASSVLDDGLGRGNVIWPIRLLISPEKDAQDALVEFDNWVYYNVVYRNGEPVDHVNYYEPHPFFVDPDPLPEADYSLRTFYSDGSSSELSEPLHVKFTSVGEIFEAIDASYSLDRSAGIIKGSTEVKRMSLIALDGKKVASVDGQTLSIRGLKGTFVLTLSTEKGNKAFKVII